MPFRSFLVINQKNLSTGRKETIEERTERQGAERKIGEEGKKAGRKEEAGGGNEKNSR